ncbi:50S ribosomal protein L16 [archaeon]|nr:50S ribosomal protein L16 [archaeon]
MASLRKANAYRNVTRAYTRKSKYKKKGFIKAVPTHKIVRFHMGDNKKEFSDSVKLVSKEKFQIRHNALESCRVLINRQLMKKFGSKGYHFYINIYPHHVLRDNRMLTGAGADRMQTGMQQAFGKVTGTAAQVKKGTTIFTVNVPEDGVEFVRGILSKAKPRIAGKIGVV